MSEDPGALLLKAVRSLPPEEQDVVLSALLSTAVSTTSEPIAWFGSQGPPRTIPVTTLAMRREVQQRFFERFASEAGEPGSWKVLPIRLTEDGYDRLRDWCQTHDYRMAVVVRGLVDRFLAGQASS